MNMNGIGQWNLVAYLIEKTGTANTVGAALIVAGGILLCMIIPYLLGSLNFGCIISQKQYHDDVRTHGSGNAGTTNMLRTYGKKAAVMTLLGDMAKALVAVGLGHVIFCIDVAVLNEAGEITARYFDPIGAAIAGISVMVGHMFPCFFKFKGGKGVATSASVILMLDLLNPLHRHIPIVFIICFAAFVIIVAGTKYVSLGSIMGLILYPIIYTSFNSGGFSGIVSVLMAILVVWAHRENIKRLRDGKESKLSFGKKKKAEAPVEEPAEVPVKDTVEAENVTDKSQSPVFVTEAPEAFEFQDDGKHQFITCTGCGHTIPQSRKICLYCKTENRQYIPDPQAKSEEKGQKKKSKK
ncbi:MAG: glycerol-3-phosphate 1-O-acyltransferase PlsY [Clostridia bacterium]|nr:glycerol-3-phosphate 1-O-acyltransferase PlsY [Clostridia bacterium]